MIEVFKGWKKRVDRVNRPACSFAFWNLFAPEELGHAPLRDCWNWSPYANNRSLVTHIWRGFILLGGYSMTDDSDRYQFSQSEITAMRYAYRQLLAEHPERFPDRKAKENLAKSVVEPLHIIKSTAAKDTSEIFTVILEEDG